MINGCNTPVKIDREDVDFKVKIPIPGFTATTTERQTRRAARFVGPVIVRVCLIHWQHVSHRLWA